MVDYKQVLLDIVTPIVENASALKIQQMEGVEEGEIVLCVYANSEDTARLIGRQGSMATSIRQMMSVASRLSEQKVTIKFESY